MDHYECPDGHRLDASGLGAITHCPFCGKKLLKLTRLGGPTQPHLRLVPNEPPPSD